MTPTAVGVGAAGVLAFPGIWTASALRVVEASCRVTLNKTSLEVLYLPIPPEIKNRTRIFIDSVVDGLSDGLAGLLLVVTMNVLLFVAVLITGLELKIIIGALTPFFGPAVGILAFVFVYWLPFVFLHQQFHLSPSLKAALRIARARLSHSTFPALLLLAPIVVSVLLPDRVPIVIDLLVNVVSGVMGWIAYIYCVEVLRDQQPNTGSEAPA